MSCSAATRFRWCYDLPTVYRDGEGDRFCVYHAPAGHKGVGLDEFNRMVFDRVSNECESSGAVDLSGTVFEGPVSFVRFGEADPLCEVSFSGARFTGGADFSRVVFGGKADFSGAVFDEDADYTEALFTGPATFEGAVFNKDVLYESAKFQEKAHFFDTVFNGWSNFRKVEFCAELYFSWGAFTGGGDFEKAKFGGRFIFKRRMVEGGPEGAPARRTPDEEENG